LKNLDNDKVSLALKQFQTFYGNKLRLFDILHLKEENYQEGFLREIFVQSLGYTIRPDLNYNLTTEYKNQTDSKKADGAIIKNNYAIGVIELKSTKTFNLDTIKNQAFNYKNNQPDCRYVITSNFHYLRFYIDNSTEYEEFDLFELTEQQFKVFYLILSCESVFNDIPLKMKEETKFHEESISDKFYKDYKAFKDHIFENLVNNNPQYDKLTLFKKSQKLLDRFLFVYFGEDCGLCPPNSIQQIIDQWRRLQDDDVKCSLYSRFQKMFEYLDKGHKGKHFEFSGYNGGLFRPDELLDNDKTLIDDDSYQDYRELFSIIFTDFYLFDQLYGIEGIEEEKVNYWLKKMQMNTITRFKEGRFTNTDLSTGQRKRLAFIAAILEDKPILILDEFAADQDPVFRKYFYEVILKELKVMGKTVIAVTHDDHYFHIPDRVLKMDSGLLMTFSPNK